MENPLPYSQAPLPFIGQKRRFIKAFQQVIDKHIPDTGQGWTIIDVFGGSGLLAHNAKYLKPDARVIYNDFDGYATRLQHINDTNRLRKILYQMLAHEPKGVRIKKEIKQKILDIIKQFDGFVDTQTVATWILFSGSQIASIAELDKKTFYNGIRQTDYSQAKHYLDGLEIVCESFISLMPRFYNQPNTLFILDPPYVSTNQSAYNLDKYFGIVEFLRLMDWVRPPFIFI